MFDKIRTWLKNFSDSFAELSATNDLYSPNNDHH